MQIKKSDNGKIRYFEIDEFVKKTCWEKSNS